MHPPLDEWDAAYVQSLESVTESATFEKKASPAYDPDGKKGETRDELAKQVCAFANAGDGFLVYGFDDKTGKLDAGVMEKINRQPIKAHVEGWIPKLLHPPITSCQAMLIPIPGHHAADRGVLVVSIPLSERRPHSYGDVAYIRAGEHSVPMRLQTFQDISSRGTAPQVEIVDVGKEGFRKDQHMILFEINPRVKLVAGSVCHYWCVEIDVSEGCKVSPRGATPKHMRNDGMQKLNIIGEEPLFQQRLTRVLRSESIFVTCPGIAEVIEITISLYAEAAQPVKRTFTLKVGES